MAYGPMVKELYHWESLWFIVSAPLNLIEIRKMRGNFARVFGGVTDSRMDLFDMLFLIGRKQALLYHYCHNFSVKYRQTNQDGKVFQADAFTRKDEPRFPRTSRPPLSRDNRSRCPVKVMVGADDGDYRKHHSATTTRWNGMARGPGKKSQRCKGRVSPAGQSMASKMERMTWKWRELEHLAVELDTKFSLVWLLISGSTCATNVTKKEFAIRCNFDASCAEMWVGDLGYVEIEESVCCCHHYPP